MGAPVRPGGGSTRGVTALRRSRSSILIFWAPLAATWLMMAVEGPFLAAVIARLPEPKFNLAAHGVALAFAILVEAPVIMIMSASTALVTDRASFHKLKSFTYALNAATTAVMVAVLLPPVFRLLMQTVIGLPDEVAELTHGALLLFLPWPAAIGYRRFYQGLLIRAGRTKLVAYGTVIRLGTMAATAVGLYALVAPAGAYVGAAALSAGVCLEAIASRVMARTTVRALFAEERPRSTGGPVLDYRRIAAFYYPLALTSLLGLAVHPMLTFFMGRAPSPVESLAAFPVVHALSFVFRALGLSFQEAAIALLGDRLEHFPELSQFATGLGLAAAAGLGLIAFTPAAEVWFQTLSGLSPDLAAVALTPARILVPLPALSVLLSFQRALLVQGRATRPVTGATATEVVVIGTVFAILGWGMHITGVTAAMASFVIGRLAANLYLVGPCRRALRDAAASGS